MKDKTNSYVERVFSNLSEGNPLKELNNWTKTMLWARLTMLNSEREGAAVDKFFRQCDDLATIAKSMRELSVALEKIGSVDAFQDMAIFKNKIFRRLPEILKVSAEHLNLQMEQLGAQGHKKSTNATREFVTTSEWLKLETGNYNDEHLLDLLLSVQNVSEPNGDPEKLRRRRKRFIQNYPSQYQLALADAHRLQASSKKKVIANLDRLV